MRYLVTMLFIFHFSILQAAESQEFPTSWHDLIPAKTLFSGNATRFFRNGTQSGEPFPFPVLCSQENIFQTLVPPDKSKYQIYTLAEGKLFSKAKFHHGGYERNDVFDRFFTEEGEVGEKIWVFEGSSPSTETASMAFKVKFIYNESERTIRIEAYLNGRLHASYLGYYAKRNYIPGFFHAAKFFATKL